MGRMIVEEKGNKYGEWTVIELSKNYVPGSGVDALWVCQCSCGTIRDCKGTSLRRGAIVSCGCKRLGMAYVTRRRNLEKQRREADRPRMLANQVARGYRRNAAEHGREFSLSLEDVLRLITGDCLYCGKPPSNEIRTAGKFAINGMKYSGIDRVDNSRGYEVDNCVSCCGNCNKVKLKMSAEEFIDLCHRVSGRRTLIQGRILGLKVLKGGKEA